MDAQDAFDILDALAKEPVSELTPLQEEALRCAAESPEIAREYRLRTPFDRQIAERMDEVEIPAGLMGRLLANTERESNRSAPVVTAAKPDSAPQRGISRRMVLTALTGAAASICALYFYLQPVTLDSGTIDQSLIVLWSAESQPFNGDFQPELPLGGWRSTSVRFESNWHGAIIGENSQHNLAFKRFEFLSSRRTSHEGLLAVIPAENLASPPTNRDPFSGEVPRYLTASDGSQYAVVSWVEPEFKLVYFLAVPAEDQTLKALQDAVTMPIS